MTRARERKRLSGWEWVAVDPPKPTLHEQEPPSKPLLYGPTGEALVPAKPAIGFKP